MPVLDTLIAILSSSAAVLYAIGMVVLVAYGCNLLWYCFLLVKHERNVSHRGPSEIDTSLVTNWPAVTVQLPVYNEKHVVERLIDAAAQLEYPSERMEIQVLDDSTDRTVQRVASRVDYWQERGVDIRHIRRSHRNGFKAGALQNGLQKANGSLVAVFDADFVPPPEFLRQTVPHFQDEDVGLVQARWDHMNRDDSLLTRIQAMSLDAHFALEQVVRSRTGYFMNFNGTAGIWRKECIEESGGWQGDTLTEDLDLSYRAQLVGWEFAFLPRFKVPAELPVDVGALRAQQFRWAKGAITTAGKLLRPLWRSSRSLAKKLQGTIHLGAHVTFPCILVVALLHAPLLVLEAWGLGPGMAYFGVMGLGIWAFLGLVLSQVYAHRSLYADWMDRLSSIPWFLAGTLGFAVTNTRAVVDALRGARSGFVRTPKFRLGDETRDGNWMASDYIRPGDLADGLGGELFLAGYSVAGLAALVWIGEWVAVPFQLLFAGGFSLMSGFTVYQYWKRRRMQVSD